MGTLAPTADPRRVTSELLVCRGDRLIGMIPGNQRSSEIIISSILK